MKSLIYSCNNFSLIKNFRTLFMLVLLTGCSTITTALNPVEWYNGARDAIVGSDAEKEEENEISPRGALVNESSDGFAKISSVPARPKAVSGEEQKIISGGLIGDVDASRKYSNEILGRQSKGGSLSLSPEMRADSAVTSPPTLKSSNPDTLVEPLSWPEPELKTANAYLVPPKPNKLSPVQNKTKLKSKTRKLLTSKSPVSVRPKMNKLPAVNPNPPKIGNVPSFAENIRAGQTVVISGSGVHQMSFATTGSRAHYRRPPSNSNVSNVNYSGQLEEGKKQKSYQVATILFPNGSSRVGKGDRRVLRQVIAQHKRVGGMLRIVGHASLRSGTNDPILHKMTNFQISAARAERVAKELVRMGVKANKLFVGSVSDRDPRYYEYMPSGEAGNRRAEIFIDLL